MRLFVTTAAVLLAFSVSARADGAAPRIIQAAASPSAKTVRLICRPMFHEGTLIKSTDCRTQEEWDRLRRDAEREISDFQNLSYR